MKFGVEEIQLKKYKVGPYVFDDFYTAKKIANALSFPDQKICDDCKGKGKTHQAVGRSMDNGGEGYTQYFSEYRCCKTCAGNGFLVSKIEWVAKR